MIEKTIINYLGTVQNLPVFAEVPLNAPAEYILIEKTGGSETNHIRQATVVVLCVSRNSLENACRIAEDVRTKMLEIVVVPSVFSCRINAGPYNFTDPDTKNYRYQTVFDIYHK